MTQRMRELGHAGRTISSGSCVVSLLLLSLGFTGCDRTSEPDVERITAAIPAAPTTSAAATPATESYQGFLNGRITTVDGAIYEGRLRWGRDQEAFWGDYFNGAKDENPWAAEASAGQQPLERTRLEIFGLKIGRRSHELDRQFMARFGDIARIEMPGKPTPSLFDDLRDVQVTLKSGTTIVLDRQAAGDIDDGVQVWDGRLGVVDVDARQIRTIAFLPTAPFDAPPSRLHGTVRTRLGDFTGFIQWDRQDSVGTDTLDGRTPENEISLRYDTIRSIARHSRGSALVTLHDGSEVVLSASREVTHETRGIYVDDRRYGRVLISWDAFTRVDFSRSDSGPAYADFLPGRPLAGSVTTRAGRRLAGRLVYDFDESETSETFDAPVQGVDYTIPFGLIRSIIARGEEGHSSPRARVVLLDDEVLTLDRSGDLGKGHAGLLIFVDGSERPEYLPWADVAQIDFDDVRSEGAERRPVMPTASAYAVSVRRTASGS